MKHKIIGLCHGVFDLVHYGHILHFEKSKSKVNWLVVSVTQDKNVNKGPRRPYYNVNERVKFLKSLKFIDEVIISDSASAINSLKKVKPNLYFKGVEYKDQKVKLNLFEEEKKFCKKNKIKILYTKDKTYSSSNLINSFFEFNPELKKNIQKIKKKYSFEKITNIIKKSQKNKITIFGDPIIDKFKYVSTIGTSSKAPSIAVINKNTEVYKGGSVAVAEMLSHLGYDVELVMFDSSKNILKKKISKKIKVINCFKINSFPEIERVVDDGRNYVKLLQSYNIDDIYITKKQENSVIKILNGYKSSNNFFLVIDFGFNFLNKRIINHMDKIKISYSLNCHLNSLNLTSNHYSKYRNFNFITFNKREFEINFRKFNSLDEKFRHAQKVIKKPFAVTLGKKGSIFFNKKKKYFFPAIHDNVIDPVGCGDAFFSIASVIYKTTKDPLISNFLANVYAALHGTIICNKSFTQDKKFYNTIKTLIS